MSENLIADAMGCDTQSQADELMAKLVAAMRAACPDMSEETADHEARERIGYRAGHCSHAVRDRVERLFKTAHPIFGAIRYNGAPTIEQAARLGIEYGKASRDVSTHNSKHKDPWIAVSEIAREDPRRSHQFRTGILTRALLVDGKFGDCDIACLTCDSLIRYLQARGGRNVFAEATVLLILGHELPAHMVPPTRPPT